MPPTSTGKKVGDTLLGTYETVSAFNTTSAPKMGISAVEKLIALAKDKLNLGEY